MFDHLKHVYRQVVAGLTNKADDKMPWNIVRWCMSAALTGFWIQYGNNGMWSIPIFALFAMMTILTAMNAYLSAEIYDYHNDIWWED